MATTTLGADSARVIPFPFPQFIAPDDLAARRVVRHSLRAAIDELVGLLDVLDGVSDQEDDDASGQCDEDGINTLLVLVGGDGPGCTISDPDAEHDGREQEDCN